MLHLSVNSGGKIPFASISRTFASGKAEKMVQKFMGELGMKEEVFVCHSCVFFQNGCVDPDTFTFDKFYTLVTKICPRIDVMDIFQRLATDKLYITCDKLIEFLNEASGETQDRDD